MNACPDLLAALRLRERDLEMDAAALRARLEEVREMIALAVGPQRRRRRTEPTEPPQHVPGAVHQPPDDDELPLQSNAPGA
jgi:hypothetical protein